MNRLLVAALVATIASPALAADPTTLEVVSAHGIVMSAYGIEIPVAYTPDGKWSAKSPTGPVGGTWRIDGDKLCTRTPGDPAETCAVYPAGKKPGDSFEVPGAMGPAMGVVKVRING